MFVEWKMERASQQWKCIKLVINTYASWIEDQTNTQNFMNKLIHKYRDLRNLIKSDFHNRLSSWLQLSPIILNHYFHEIRQEYMALFNQKFQFSENLKEFWGFHDYQ